MHSLYLERVRNGMVRDTATPSLICSNPRARDFFGGSVASIAFNEISILIVFKRVLWPPQKRLAAIPDPFFSNIL
jgi:hypothetical protein